MAEDGKTSEDSKSKPAKNRQKDKDARWAKKNERSYFGYKNHIGVREVGGGKAYGVMADKVAAAVRSKMMAAVRGKDTGPERAVRGRSTHTVIATGCIGAISRVPPTSFYPGFESPFLSMAAFGTGTIARGGVDQHPGPSSGI
jgi:hypothetical protein